MSTSETDWVTGDTVDESLAQVKVAILEADRKLSFLTYGSGGGAGDHMLSA